MALPEIRYRRYVIRGLLNGGAYRVAASIAGTVLNAGMGQQRLILHSVSGPDYDLCVTQVKALLDERDAVLNAQRRVDPNIPFPVPTVGEYVEAFSRLALSEHERKMLLGHAAAPGQSLSADELAGEAGWSNYGPANSVYGKLGTKVGNLLGLKDKTPTTFLASDSVIDGTVVWRMHDEVRAAVRAVFGV